jgi:hypothetical protein
MPYAPRHYLDDPADAVVWRYMNLEKLLSILLDRALFFSSLNTLAHNDKYEGQLTSCEVDSLKIPLDAYKSDAMWKIYATGIKGVAVRSTVSRLKQCFHNSPQDISLGTISYSCVDPAVRPHVDPDHIVRRCAALRRSRVDPPSDGDKLQAAFSSIDSWMSPPKAAWQPLVGRVPTAPR